MSQDSGEPTEMTPCSGCGEDTLDDTLASVTADPSSDYRLCPTCVQEMNREARAEREEDERMAREGVGLPACCHADALATPCERAYAAYNRAGDPATAGLNFRGDPCPTWDELPENIRVKWRAASDAVVMEVEDTIRAAEVEVKRMGVLLEANLAEVAALRGGILHFQAQLVAAQGWILDNQIGLQPVQIAFSAPEVSAEDPGDPNDAARGGGNYGDYP